MAYDTFPHPLSYLCSFIFLEVEPSKVRVLQYKVERNIRELLRLIKIHLGVGNRVGLVHEYPEYRLLTMSIAHYRWSHRNSFLHILQA